MSLPLWPFIDLHCFHAIIVIFGSFRRRKTRSYHSIHHILSYSVSLSSAKSSHHRHLCLDIPESSNGEKKTRPLCATILEKNNIHARSVVCREVHSNDSHVHVIRLRNLAERLPSFLSGQVGFEPEGYPFAYMHRKRLRFI